MLIYPTLYKLTSTGAIQYWAITVEDNIIRTEYGQLDTPSPQFTEDVVREGKNIGKANETTKELQAVMEAKSRWEKKKKSGYVDSLDKARAGEVDLLIEGGISPMLAHSFSKQGHKIEYPAYVSPKLDGIRLIAIVDNGVCTLWSRTRKQIHSLPHIIAELESKLEGVSIALDGEAYNHEFRNNFEKITSIVRQDKPAPDCELVQYHIFDCVSAKDYHQRMIDVEKHSLYTLPSVIEVPQILVSDEHAAMQEFAKFRLEGYEGAMIRNMSGPYMFKRSYDLLKIKEFDDAEFKIVDIEEGRGKLTGHVGAFVCETDSGARFNVKMSGELDNLRLYWEDHSLWRGKYLTVQYQGLTGTDKVPRFPVGLRFRDF